MTTMFLIIGAPLWIPLVLVAFIVAVSLYISVWGPLLALGIAVIALFLCGAFFAFAVVIMLMKGTILSAIIYAGLGLFSVGIGLFGIIGCVYAAKGLAKLTAWSFRRMGNALAKKREEQV